MFSVIPSFHSVVGERTRIMSEMIFLEFECHQLEWSLSLFIHYSSKSI